MPDVEDEDKPKEDDDAAKVPASGEEAAVGKAMDNLAEGGTDKAVDSNKAEAAVAQLQESRAKEHEESRKRAQELAKVTVSKEDAQLVAKEFDMDAKKADAVLRENGGDLRKTLVSLLSAGLPSES